MKNLKNHLPLIIAPYSETVSGGISSWTKNLLVYSSLANNKDLYQIYYYMNHMKSILNMNFFARIITGFILYSKLSFNLIFYTIKTRPKVLHVASSATIGLFKDIMIIWIAKLTKTPIVIHWRFGRIPQLAKLNNWEWKLLKYVIKTSNCSIVIDKRSYDTLIELGFLNIVNIPNPIALDIEQKVKKQLEKNSVRAKGRILFVGHIMRDKGIFELVQACVEIPAIDELLLIGPFEEEVKNKLLLISQKREHGNWLKMIGQQRKDQVLDYMGSTQILVLPSYTEGFPNVVIEAMAMGCAIVATDVGAIPEMIDFQSEKPCGICVPAKNIDKLKDAIEYLLNNPERAVEMGRTGNVKVLANYTLEKIVSQYIEVWNSVCSSRKENFE